MKEIIMHYIKLMGLCGILTVFCGAHLYALERNVQGPVPKNPFDITLKVGEKSGAGHHFLEEPSEKGLWTLKLHPLVPAGRDIVKVKEKFTPSEVTSKEITTTPTREFVLKGLRPGKQKGTYIYTRDGKTLYPGDKLEFEITVTKD